MTALNRLIQTQRKIHFIFIITGIFYYTIVTKIQSTRKCIYEIKFINIEKSKYIY